MSQKTVKSNGDLANAIRERRNELGMTIEEAASASGVGIKTWCRYEAGESIRADKVKGICKALCWRGLPSDLCEQEETLNIEEYRKNKYWPQCIDKMFGVTAALSFLIGSEILGDYINEDLAELKKLPSGSHLGQVTTSMLIDDLPEQFITRYDYEFLFALKCTLRHMRESVRITNTLKAHSVLQELVLTLIVEESRMLLEEGEYVPEDNWDEWIFDVFDDVDIITLLYSDIYVSSDNNYHFEHWLEGQFYCD